ncbi:MAG TPA: tRNA guanosine(34) transglycosylase Tgt [Planctomycetota bacterium]|nr:tRNA guanosine(34) transglycosylase Tgt [Planctomycetota bacterium]
MSFQIVAECGRARAGLLETPHGTVETPAFMPVGTRGSVRGILPTQLAEAKAQILLANAYHLFLRPGDGVVKDLGGLHGFTGWTGPWLTDSGGFQVFSLGELVKVVEEGVTFKSPIDGTSHFLTPEDSMRIQESLGADIIMAFDECVRQPATPEQTSAAVDRTIRWARRCRDAHRREDQMLFGIVQGGTAKGERDRCAAPLLRLDFPGYAIGGLSVGESRDAMLGTLDHTVALLPRAKPRYFMGLGKPEDLLDAIRRGIDMFDCVIGTRNGRHGTVFTSEGALHLRNKRFERDQGPLDPACGCPACRGFSRAYLSHLFKAEEMLGPILGSLHNTWHLVGLVRKAREEILRGTFR